MVDLETHEVVDLLPDRERQTLLTWLRERPGIEIVSRDRASAYADAAREGAPHAIQVADRFHLLMNLRDALQRILERQRNVLPRIKQDTNTSQSISEDEKQAESFLAAAHGDQSAQPAKPSKEAALASFIRDSAREKVLHDQTRSQESRTRRLARYEEVRDLHRQGRSIREIARTLGLSRPTVSKFVEAETFPERIPLLRKGFGDQPSKLDPFVPYLLKRWGEGEFNGTHLYHEICEQGYRGSRPLVALLVADLRRSIPAEPRASRSTPKADSAIRLRTVTQGRSLSEHMRKQADKRRLSPRLVSYLFVKTPEKLTEKQQKQVEQTQQAHPDLRVAYELAQDFVNMLHEQNVMHLDEWLHLAAESAVKELKGFVGGIRRDYAAVRAAFSSPVSNGQVEGQVHRLKLIKRKSYGRANFDLLRLQVMHRSGQNHQKCV